MPIDRDIPSGYMTTGHDWNGIKELNTRVPRAVWFFLILTGLFAVGYWLLMPAFPLGTTFTKGILGANDRTAVTAQLKQEAAVRAGWTGKLAEKSYAEIQADSRLMASVRQTARALFGDNCAACHGQDASGRPGFPDLTRSSLWGNTPDVFAETIRVGINSNHKDSRVSQMPSFGRDHMIEGAAIGDVVAYLLSLSGAEGSGNAEAGKAVFAANCAACHGPDAKGKFDAGAPDLTGRNRTYGDDEGSIRAVLWDGLKGQMPSWEARLSPLDRKILTLYLFDLRKARP